VALRAARVGAVVARAAEKEAVARAVARAVAARVVAVRVVARAEETAVARVAAARAAVQWAGERAAEKVVVVKAAGVKEEGVAGAQADPGATAAGRSVALGQVQLRRQGPAFRLPFLAST
jgi:hypothetical protein